MTKRLVHDYCIQIPEHNTALRFIQKYVADQLVLKVITHDSAYFFQF